MRPFGTAFELASKHVKFTPYSGRFMFGAQCPSLSGENEGDIMRMLLPALRDRRMTDEMAEEISNFTTDELGLGIVAYWPDVAMVPDFGDLRSMCASKQYTRIPEPVEEEYEMWRTYLLDHARSDLDTFVDSIEICIEDINVGRGSCGGLDWDDLRTRFGDVEISDSRHHTHEVYAGQLRIGSVNYEQRMLWCCMAALHLIDESLKALENSSGVTDYGLRIKTIPSFGFMVDSSADYRDIMIEIMSEISTEVFDPEYTSDSADDFGPMMHDHGILIMGLVGALEHKSERHVNLRRQPAAPFRHDHLGMLPHYADRLDLDEVRPEDIRDEISYGDMMSALRDALAGGFVPLVIEEIICAMLGDLDEEDDQSLQGHREHFQRWYKMFCLSQTTDLI